MAASFRLRFLLRRHCTISGMTPANVEAEEKKKTSGMIANGGKRFAAQSGVRSLRGRAPSSPSVSLLLSWKLMACTALQVAVFTHTSSPSGVSRSTRTFSTLCWWRCFRLSAAQKRKHEGGTQIVKVSVCGRLLLLLLLCSQFRAALARQLTALFRTSATSVMSTNSISLASPPLSWIICDVSLSLRQLATTRRVSTWRSLNSL